MLRAVLLVGLAGVSLAANLRQKDFFETRAEGFNAGPEGLIQMYMKAQAVQGATLLDREQAVAGWNPVVDVNSPMLKQGFTQWKNDGKAMLFRKPDGSETARCSFGKARKTGDAFELALKCRAATAEPRFASKRVHAGNDAGKDSYALPFWHAGVPGWAPAAWSHYHAWGMTSQGYWACPTVLVESRCRSPMLYPFHGGLHYVPQVAHPYAPHPYHYAPYYDPSTPPAHVNIDGLVGKTA